MPVVGDLGCAGKRFCDRQRIAAAPVAGDNLDLGMSFEPILRCRRFAVLEQPDRASALQIADDRAVALIAPPRSVVNADHSRRRKAWPAPPAHLAKQCVPAERRHQTIGEARRRASAERKSQVMNENIRPFGPARQRRSQIEPLHENPTRTGRRITSKPARLHKKSHASSRRRQVVQFPDISAMNAVRNRAATRAATCQK